jgi:hypothetical protein
MANTLSEITSDDVVAVCPDYSGGSVNAVCDLMLVSPNPHKGAFIELKSYRVEREKRVTVCSGTSSEDHGRAELQRLVDGTPPWGTAWLAVKLNNTQLIMSRAKELLSLSPDKRETHGPGKLRWTPSGNLSIRKPTTDEWPSQTAGMTSPCVILRTVGVPSEYITAGGRCSQ